MNMRKLISKTLTKAIQDKITMNMPNYMDDDTDPNQNDSKSKTKNNVLF